jgi:hypothetical protein
VQGRYAPSPEPPVGVWYDVRCLLTEVLEQSLNLFIDIIRPSNHQESPHTSSF